MLTNLLRAGYPAILVLTHEVHRAEEALKVDGWHFYDWDCIRGTRDLANNTLTNDIRDPVEALAFLDNSRQIYHCHT